MSWSIKYRQGGIGFCWIIISHSLYDVHAFKKNVAVVSSEKSEMGTKPQMKAKYKNMRENSKDSNVKYFKWTSSDEDNLKKMKSK